MNEAIRVLVVEDSVADMEIDVMALESAGFDVFARRVETERDFINALEKELPDVVLSDHSMPRFDAHRALRLLRQYTEDVPFIIVSGKIGEIAAVDLMKSGANDYVVKSELARLAPAVRRELREVTVHRRAAETQVKLAERERTLENLMQNLPGMVYRLTRQDDDWVFEFASNGASALTGYSPEALVNDRRVRFQSILYIDESDPDAGDVLSQLEEGGDFFSEHRIVTRDGDVKWVWHRAKAFDGNDGAVDFIEGFITDITTQKINQARLTYLAHHDVLTGLANRSLFEDMVTTNVARARRTRSAFSLLFIDLDDFKDINDSFGHSEGDGLLRTIAERLMTVARESDSVARLGGDEFAVVTDSGASTQEAAVVAQRILDALSEPLFLDDKEIRIGASIGIATFPHDGTSASELLSNADAAMYSAKEAGRNTFRFFASEMNARARDLVEMRSAIPAAIQGDQFELYFQPQVALDTETVIGAEALLRWNHPERGQLNAGQFIPVAEEGGMIGDIDRWVMRAICIQARLWNDAGISFGRLAFNLSGRQFHDPELPQLLRRLFTENGVDPTGFEVELTETAMIQNVESARNTIRALKDLGLIITVDDFGKGYSSLSYLKRFAVDRLKIDRTFVRDLPGDKDDLQICRSIIALSDSMGLEVVAEGIESAEQAALLLENGCRIGQGFHFAMPSNAVHFAASIRDRTA